MTGKTEWEAVALLYEGLVRMAPTIGALVGRAAAVAEARGARNGLDLLDRVAGRAGGHLSAVLGAVRAHLWPAAARGRGAQAYDRAIGLCSEDAMRAFLIGRAGTLAGE